MHPNTTSPPIDKARRLLLLTRDGPANTTTSGLGVLTPDLKTPVVSETSVGPDLLQPLEVLTETLVDNVGEDVLALAVVDVSLPVKEPRGDLELGGVLHDGDDSLELVGVELTSPLVEVDIGLLADQVGVSSTDTLDLSKSVHDLTATLNVGVKETQDVLELLVGLEGSEGHVVCEYAATDRKSVV